MGYADALTLLIENDIKLHLLQPLDLIVKGKSSFQEDKNVYGFNADEVFTIRNVRNLQGDRELRRQLVLPKDFCTPLALETNGTLFDLEKIWEKLVHENLLEDLSTSANTPSLPST